MMNKEMVLYLSGPISSDPAYRKRFWKAEKELRRRGYREIINPAGLCDVINRSMSYEDIMDIDLLLLTKADALVQLPGWEKSCGASREYGYALAQDKIILPLKVLTEGG